MSEIETISKEINYLIEKNNDIHKQLLEVVDFVDGKPVRGLLKNLAERHRVFSLELTAVLKGYNAEAEVDVHGTISGALTRGWLDIKASLSMEDDESLLDASTSAQKKTLADYKNLMATLELPTEFREILESQIKVITRSLHELETLNE